MSTLKKSSEMLEKQPISVAIPAKDFIDKCGKKGDSYEDILIEHFPGLKEHLLKEGFLETALEYQERLSREDASPETSEEVSS